MQYIHFVFNLPLYNLGIKIYDGSGVMVFDRSEGNSGNISISVTSGDIYYFEVWPNGADTYKVAFNATETPPSP